MATTCIAIYDFNSSADGDLSFKQGDILVLLQTEGNWWKGTQNGKQGFFPSNYVEFFDSPHELPPPVPQPEMSPEAIKSQSNSNDTRKVLQEVTLNLSLLSSDQDIHTQPLLTESMESPVGLSDSSGECVEPVSKSKTPWQTSSMGSRRRDSSDYSPGGHKKSVSLPHSPIPQQEKSVTPPKLSPDFHKKTKKEMKIEKKQKKIELQQERKRSRSIHKSKNNNFTAVVTSPHRVTRRSTITFREGVTIEQLVPEVSQAIAEIDPEIIKGYPKKKSRESLKSVDKLDTKENPGSKKYEIDLKQKEDRLKQIEEEFFAEQKRCIVELNKRDTELKEKELELLKKEESLWIWEEKLKMKEQHLSEQDVIITTKAKKVALCIQKLKSQTQLSQEANTKT